MHILYRHPHNLGRYIRPYGYKPSETLKADACTSTTKP